MKGECFGEEEIISNSSRNYTANAASVNCKLLWIKKEKFLEIHHFEKKRWNIDFFFEEKKKLLEKIFNENTLVALQTEENQEDEKKDDKKIKLQNMRKFFQENKDFSKHIKMIHLKTDEKTKEKIKSRTETETSLKSTFSSNNLLKNYEISPILKYSAVPIL
jgi:hypothetical protein